ncbi:TetR/AcrR family transcriptional regulator [Actinocrispum wychmicini]|uniref:TetR family transcriptional regulator n=1 Tax=Actinocrispum wychmicini TaxID=1213861 RepID=A0A4R2JYR6_9PSEU|nr:TetR family transcriptional regulator [Actinocrispum wychmicini]TCO62409.1 TetR family transcriptional regulator [Actinocrispum wychmicini]
MTAAARGREVRGRLLTAAAELVAERGWTAVSTRILAERAGVTPSVVHYHFPSMPALLNEAVIEAIRQFANGFEACLDIAATPTEALDVILASLADQTAADPMPRLFIEAYLAAARDEELHARLVEVTDELRRRVSAWLGGHGVSAPDDTAAVLIAALDGLVLQRGIGARVDAGPVLRRLVEEEKA